MRATKSKINRKIRRRKMIEQKLIGILFLIISVVILIVAAHSQTPDDLDATPVLLFIPMGICLLFSKECWIN